MEGKRSFKIVSVKKVNGCHSKFNVDSRFISSTPVGSAKKAISGLCRRKKIRGACAFYVQVQETTRGSNRCTFEL